MDNSNYGLFIREQSYDHLHFLFNYYSWDISSSFAESIQLDHMMHVKRDSIGIIIPVVIGLGLR